MTCIQKSLTCFGIPFHILLTFISCLSSTVSGYLLRPKPDMLKMESFSMFFGHISSYDSIRLQQQVGLTVQVMSGLPHFLT